MNKMNMSAVKDKNCALKFTFRIGMGSVLVWIFSTFYINKPRKER